MSRRRVLAHLTEETNRGVRIVTGKNEDGAHHFSAVIEGRRKERNPLLQGRIFP